MTVAGVHRSHRRVLPGPAAGTWCHTKALRDSKLTWDSATLNRFLGSPANCGARHIKSYQFRILDDSDNLVAYFQRWLGAAARPLSCQKPAANRQWRRRAGQLHRFAPGLCRRYAHAFIEQSPSVVPMPRAEVGIASGFYMKRRRS